MLLRVGTVFTIERLYWMSLSKVYYIVATSAASFFFLVSIPIYIQPTRPHSHSSCHRSLVVHNNMNTFSGERLSFLFFDHSNETNRHWTCQVCKKKIKQRPSYTNICSHVTSCRKSNIAMQQDLNIEESKELFKKFLYPA